MLLVCEEKQPGPRKRGSPSTPVPSDAAKRTHASKDASRPAPDVINRMRVFLSLHISNAPVQPPACFRTADSFAGCSGLAQRCRIHKTWYLSSYGVSSYSGLWVKACLAASCRLTPDRNWRRVPSVNVQKCIVFFMNAFGSSGIGLKSTCRPVSKSFAPLRLKKLLL